MDFVVLGTGDAFSSKHFGSSAVVIAPEGQVLIDAPDALMRALASASASSGVRLGPDGIDDILVTHIHGDHVNGLEAFGFWRWLEWRRTGRTLPRLHTTNQVADRLWHRLAPAMDQGGTAALSDYFELRVLPKSSPARIAGLDVRHRMGRHTVPSCGFLISDGRRTLGWSGDTTWDPGHVEWLSEADFVVHETSPAPAHTPVDYLNALPPALRAKMALIHMPDDFDAESTSIRLLTDGELVRF
ncbi:MAG: MBL fold metallo-hydrolase [Planctomycetes bacterium]|nr:MBL fold metallo-hydrolase [Planctomycetota bacterium]